MLLRQQETESSLPRRTPRIALLLLLLASSSLLALARDYPCTAKANAITLCAVLSDPTKYDGQEITVRGLYRMVIHGSVLTSPACGKTYVNLRGAPDYKANKHASAVIRSMTKKGQFQPVEVVIRGTFHVAHQEQCFGQNCLPYEIEDHELLCAGPPAEPGNSSGVEP